MKVIRIDERLIHGQVIIGWVENGGFENICLVHENMDQFIIDSYRHMISEASFYSVDLNNAQWPDSGRGNWLYIIHDLGILQNHIHILGTVEPDILNIGGIRHENPYRIISPYAMLDRNEYDFLMKLCNDFRIRINARELPYSEEIVLNRP